VEKAEGKMKEAYGALVGDEAQGKSRAARANGGQQARLGPRPRSREGARRAGGQGRASGRHRAEALGAADAGRQGMVVPLIPRARIAGMGDRPKRREG
jgi:hypothetical protein